MDLPKKLKSDGEFSVKLNSGIMTALPICHPTFKLWTGPKPTFDYGNKPIIDYKNKPVFAELAISRILIDAGWQSIWVETYGGTNFLKEMPTEWKLRSNNVSIPENKQSLLQRIWKISKTTACFDVLAWKDNTVLFCEAKNKGKDRLTKPQIRFIEGALACGVPASSLLIVEWSNNLK